MRNQAGFSLVEAMIAGGVTAMIMGSSLALVSSVSRTGQTSSNQTLVDQLYYQGVTIAQTPRVFVDATKNPLGLTAAQLGCLGANPPAGTNCTSFDDTPNAAISDSVDETLNHGFGPAGPCVVGEAGCTVNRTSTWQLVCKSAGSCSGVRIHLKSESLLNADGTLRRPDAGQGEARVARSVTRDRVGDVFIPARQFSGKSSVGFHCPGVGRQMIAAIDYQRRTDVCSTFDGGACRGTMDYFGPTPHCVPAQSKTCADGYGQIGFFGSQQDCVAAAELCANGGTLQNGLCVYANRWCHLASATGPSTGFTDSGAVHGAGCGANNQFYAPDAIIQAGSEWLQCKSGPATSFPLPEAQYCPVQACRDDQVLDGKTCVPKPPASCSDVTFTINEIATYRNYGNFDQAFSAQLTLDFTPYIAKIPLGCKASTYDATFTYWSTFNNITNCTATAVFTNVPAGTAPILAPGSCTRCGGNRSKYQQAWFNVGPDGKSATASNTALHWGDGGGNPTCACVKNPTITIHTVPQ